MIAAVIYSIKIHTFIYLLERCVNLNIIYFVHSITYGTERHTSAFNSEQSYIVYVIQTGTDGVKPKELILGVFNTKEYYIILASSKFDFSYFKCALS